MISIIKKVFRHGLKGSLSIVVTKTTKPLLKRFYTWRFRNEPRYSNPNSIELEEIENDLKAFGIEIIDYSPSQDQFQKFKDQSWFPVDYVGGPESSVWNEKLLEHWIASELLQLDKWGPGDVYVDVAACNSPWAKKLRERLGISAYAIDLAPVGHGYIDLPYYRSENATSTNFSDSEVLGVSLQCAFEMFLGEDDKLLIPELARILKKGGKAIILPLYMHTHYCAYSTAEYYGKGYSDTGAKEYIRMDWDGIPSSRKYDVQQLKDRLIDRILAEGMRYRLLALRNKEALGEGIYCHFILEIEK